LGHRRHGRCRRPLSLRGLGRARIVDYEPVARNVTFTPEALKRAGGPVALPETTRSLLVGNGTLNPDGTYNLATARARGWEIPEKRIPFAP
jgi:hypothetical protein